MAGTGNRVGSPRSGQPSSGRAPEAHEPSSWPRATGDGTEHCAGSPRLCRAETGPRECARAGAGERGRGGDEQPPRPRITPGQGAARLGGQGAGWAGRTLATRHGRANHVRRGHHGRAGADAPWPGASAQVGTASGHVATGSRGGRRPGRAAPGRGGAMAGPRADEPRRRAEATGGPRGDNAGGASRTVAGTGRERGRAGGKCAASCHWGGRDRRAPRAGRTGPASSRAGATASWGGRRRARGKEEGGEREEERGRKGEDRRRRRFGERGGLGRGGERGLGRGERVTVPAFGQQPLDQFQAVEDLEDSFLFVVV
eukprot:XP_020400926.1 uncharacterized protein LOC109942793 [Zea mays]